MGFRNLQEKLEKAIVTFLSNSNRFPVQYVLLNFTYIPTHTKVREFICHFSRIVLVTKPGQPIFPNYQQRRWNNFKDGWDTYVSTRFWQLMGILLICSRNLSRCKAGLVEERLHKKLHSAAILNFLLRSLFVYLLTNCSTQFFSNWKSAESVFCCRDCLPTYKISLRTFGPSGDCAVPKLSSHGIYIPNGCKHFKILLQLFY